jgi:hypothetical protein
VQAPQVRSGKRRTQAEIDKRNRYILYGLGSSGIVALAAVLIVIFAMRGGGGGTSKAADNGPTVNFAALKGIRHTKPPWPAGPSYPDLKSRLALVGLTPLAQEQLAIHEHSHLDVFVDGKHVTVPRYLGIHTPTHFTFITELHTHDAGTDGQPPAPGKLPNETPTGVVHIESAHPGPFSLGQFFAVWGVDLSKRCVGGLCATPGKPLKFYVNGKRFTGNPVKLVLNEHEEIAIVYGTPPSSIPSTYNWSQL